MKCIIVPKEDGEVVRTYIYKLKVLDSTFKVKRFEDRLCFPVTRKLSESEFAELKKLSPAIEQRDDIELKKAPYQPKSHLEILSKKFTAKEMELVPRSFDVIGDIVVVEIHEQLYAKRSTIGKALLDAHSNVKAVFAKSGKVQGVNRIRPVEHIAGENRTKTIYKEYGVRLAVDIDKAYFSPRLSEEHTRIAKQIRTNKTVVDLFCGVGPFAIPIAKRVNAVVHAIDINPAAIELLKENIALNRLKGTIHTYCGDCRVVVDKHKLENVADHIIMNLPGYAINFLDVACKVIKSGGIIHFFEFVGGENPEKIIVEDLSREVQKAHKEIAEVLQVRKVRMSAPKQWQMVVDAKIK